MHFNNSPPAPQIPRCVDQYPQFISPSADQITAVSSSQWLTSSYTPTVPQQSSIFAGRDAYTYSPTPSCQPSTNTSYPTRVSSSSLVVRSSRTSSSLAGHPYSQPRARYAAGDYVPSHHHASDLFFVQQFVPAPGWASEAQSTFIPPDASQIHPQPHTTSFPIPISASASQIPTQPPFSQAEKADIEFALCHYGNKPCFYQCRYDLYGSPCGKCIVGDRRRILRHLRNCHHLQSISATCQWENCTHPRQMRQENLSRHVVTHLGVKWICPHCRLPLSRDDAVHRHMQRMHPGVEVPEMDVIPGRGARSPNDL